MNLKLKIAILKKFPKQSDFAEKIGCHESKISKVIHGYKKLSKTETHKWMDELNCDASIFNN